MRSEPVGSAGSVSTARPPSRSTRSAISGSPQATTTGPTAAATARRQTCTIIGTPAISASGFIGRRVDASRAGIRMIGLAIGDLAGTAFTRGSWGKPAATTCPVRLLAGSAIIRLSWRRESDFLPPAARPAQPGDERKRTPMSSFEWNKIIASVLTAMIVAMVAGILASKLVAPMRLEKPVYLPPGAAEGATATAVAAPAAPKLEPIGPAMAKADPKQG